jgi:hypothetical protein
MLRVGIQTCVFLDLTRQKLLAKIVFFVAIWVAISLA